MCCLIALNYPSGQSFATVADAQMQAIDMINGDTLLADGEV